MQKLAEARTLGPEVTPAARQHPPHLPQRPQPPQRPPRQQRLVHEHTIEGLFFIVLRNRLSAPAQDSLRAAGLDLGCKLQPVYPFDTWRRCLDIAVADLYPGAVRSEGYRRLGHEVVEGLGQTLMGRALGGMARLLGPVRTLRRMSSTFRSADTSVETRITEVSSTCCELWLNDVMGRPTYYQGIIEACVGLSGGRDIEVDVVGIDGPSVTFRVEWEG